jgi:pilus assembly protein Flp/PilA
MHALLMNLIHDEEGATALEYGLLAALIASVIMLAVTELGTTLKGKFEAIKTGMG